MTKTPSTKDDCLGGRYNGIFAGMGCLVGWTWEQGNMAGPSVAGVSSKNVNENRIRVPIQVHERAYYDQEAADTVNALTCSVQKGAKKP